MLSKSARSAYLTLKIYDYLITQYDNMIYHTEKDINDYLEEMAEDWDMTPIHKVPRLLFEEGSECNPIVID